MPSHTEIGEFIWRIADHLRGDDEKADNEDVILPFTLLRRLDCVQANASVTLRVRAPKPSLHNERLKRIEHSNSAMVEIPLVSRH